MCNKVVKDDPSSMQFVSDWFVSQQQLDVWYDDDYWYHDDEVVERYDAYKKQKAQKTKIKEELMPIAWHFDSVMDWCMSENKKGRWKQQIVVF